MLPLLKTCTYSSTEKSSRINLLVAIYKPFVSRVIWPAPCRWLCFGGSSGLLKIHFHTLFHSLMIPLKIGSCNRKQNINLPFLIKLTSYHRVMINIITFFIFSTIYI